MIYNIFFIRNIIVSISANEKSFEFKLKKCFVFLFGKSKNQI